MATQTTDGEIPVSTELGDCIQSLRRLLDERASLNDSLIAVLIGHESARNLRNESTDFPKEIIQALPLMLQAIGASSHTLVKLSASPGFQTRDYYSIARSIVELCVNVCFLIAQGPAAAERALRHARQKAFTDLERESRIGPSIIRVACDPRVDLDSVPELKADLAEFTSRKGREKDWVDASLDDRIRVAGEKLGDSVLTQLHFARFLVYRHASEILHGTLFGVLHFYGLTGPGAWNLGRSAENVGQQHMGLLMAVGLALDAVVEGFHVEYGFDWAHRRSQQLTDTLLSIPYLNAGDSSNEAQQKRGGDVPG